MTAEEIKELEERVRLAEEILGDLSSGWWQAILDRADVGSAAGGRMGERVLAYWRRFEAVPFVLPPCQKCKEKRRTLYECAVEDACCKYRRVSECTYEKECTAKKVRKV